MQGCSKTDLMMCLLPACLTLVDSVYTQKAEVRVIYLYNRAGLRLGHHEEQGRERAFIGPHMHMHSFAYALDINGLNLNEHSVIYTISVIHYLFSFYIFF